MRPCTCEQISGDPTAPFTTGQCRLCWLYTYDPAYRQLWDGQPAASTGCRHLGPPTGATVACASCRGHVTLKLFACAVHEVCTTARAVPAVACCIGCPDRDPAATVLPAPRLHPAK